MNIKFLFLSALTVALGALSLGCNNGEPAKLTDAQQADVRKEVTKTMHTWIDGWEHLDLEGVMKLEADTPNFIYADVDGKQYDKAGLRKSSAEMLASCTAEKVFTQREQIYVLSPDSALYAWHGAVEFIQKDGAVLRVDPYNASFLLQRVNTNWQIIYQHESGLPPQVMKPADSGLKKL